MVECGRYLASGESESRDNKGDIPPLTQLRHVTIIWVTASQSEALMGRKMANQRTTKWLVTEALQYCYLIARGSGKSTGRPYSNVSISIQSSDLEIVEGGEAEVSSQSEDDF